MVYLPKLVMVGTSLPSATALWLAGCVSHLISVWP